MNDINRSQGMAPSDEQIANAGTGDESFTGPSQPAAPDDRAGGWAEQLPPDDQADDRADDRAEGWGEQLPSDDRVEQLPSDDRVAQPLPEDRAERLPRAGGAAPGGDLGQDGQAPAQLLEEQELQGIIGQWKEIQAEFVDEPRQAVQDADALVAELMRRLTQMFAIEREGLESRWAGGDDVSTEDLRRGLRRYHSFFERLLAA